MQASNSSSPATTTGLLSPIYPTTTNAMGAVPTAAPSQVLCPTYNFTIVSFGGHIYEIECGYTFNGDNIGLFPGMSQCLFTDCLAMCNAWTANGSTCIGVAYVVGNPCGACYPKDSNGGNQVNTGQYAARLIYAGYGDITDTPALIAAATLATSAFVSPTSGAITPVHYANPTVSIISNTLTTASIGTTLAGGGGMGGKINSTSFSLSPTSSIILTSSLPVSTTSSSHLSSTSPSSSTTTPTSASSTQVSSTVHNSLTLTSTSTPLVTSTTSLSMSTTPLSISLSGSIQVTASASVLVGVGTSSYETTSTTSSSPTTTSLSTSPHQSMLTVIPTSTSVGQPPPASTSSMIISSSSTSAGQDGDATNYVGFSTTPTPTPSPPPATEYGFQYVGCVGYAAGSGNFEIVETSTVMSIQQCLSDCYGDAFAGISGE